jgi:hypothetical protein
VRGRLQNANSKEHRTRTVPELPVLSQKLEVDGKKKTEKKTEKIDKNGFR